jgi:hypothetical protein
VNIVKNQYDGNKTKLRKHWKLSREISQIEQLYEQQQEGLLDVHTGVRTDEQNDKWINIFYILKHLHLVT